jgi:hypothetical protein
MMGRPPLEMDTRGIRDIIQFDAAGGATEAIYQMLCHERGGVTYVFRGAPARWLDVSFSRIRATGGVLVSAVRRAGRTRHVTLEASAKDVEFRIASPWPGHSVRVKAGSGTRVAPSSEGVIATRLRKGETARLSCGR